VRGTGGNDVHAVIGFNFKLTNLQAAVGIAQLARLDGRARHLRALYQSYRAGLEGIRQIQLLPFDVESGETPQWVDVLAEDRDGLVAGLAERQIHCRPFWYPIHTQQPYRRPDEAFPEAMRAASRALWLPSALSLSHLDVETVCARIRRYYEGAAA
jgi:perosamine synthetase